MPESSLASCSARAAYMSTCTPSIPDISSKNQPQEVYIFMELFSISRSLSTLTFCAGASSLPQFSSRKALTFSVDLSSMTPMYSFSTNAIMIKKLPHLSASH
jgi:hypothetical protein